MRHIDEPSRVIPKMQNAEEDAPLARRFEAARPRLRAMAHRMLGSADSADDAVQEAWLRLAGAGGVENLEGWLTTVVARVCLDALRARRSRREEPLPEGIVAKSNPSDEAMMTDAVGLAMLVALETLAPAERVAFVLHDVFDVPFDEIAAIVGRTPTAARQLASRARRRVRAGNARPEAAPDRRREIVEAFRVAARDGDMAALLAILDPEVVLRADATAVGYGALPETRGAETVAKTFSGRARHARPALLNGAPSLAWVVAGNPRVVFAFAIEGDRIVGIDLLGDPERLAASSFSLLEA